MPHLDRGDTILRSSRCSEYAAVAVARASSTQKQAPEYGSTSLSSAQAHS